LATNGQTYGHHRYVKPQYRCRELELRLNKCTTYEVQRRKNEDRAKIIMVKKSPWCNNVQLLIQDVKMSVSVSSL